MKLTVLIVSTLLLLVNCSSFAAAEGEGDIIPIVMSSCLGEPIACAVETIMCDWSEAILDASVQQIVDCLPEV